MFVVPSVAAGWNVPLPGAGGAANLTSVHAFTTLQRARRRAVRRAAVTLPVIGLIAGGVTANAHSWPTYRSASVTCRDVTLYGNFSPARGPKDKIGVLDRGEILGYEYTRGSQAMVRTGAHATLGFVQRDCITVPRAGTSGSYLWPAKIGCRAATLYANYNAAKRRPAQKIGVVSRGQDVGYQYYKGTIPTGPYTVIRKGTQKTPLFGYVLRECVDVADWAPKANWNPAR